MRESYLIQKYSNRLLEQDLSTATVDNYLSDTVSFLNWLTSYLPTRGFTIQKKQPSTFISYINSAAVSSYFRRLTGSDLSPATVNRRLSGLKKFLDFAVSEGYLPKNPAGKLEPIETSNPQDTLNSFRGWLTKQDITETTIKNYISDIRHFLSSTNTNSIALLLFLSVFANCHIVRIINSALADFA